MIGRDYYVVQGLTLVYAVGTVLVLIFSEVLPKTYAITYPDRVALTVEKTDRLHPLEARQRLRRCQ